MGSEEKYWLPRSALLDVFLQRIDEVNRLAAANSKPEPIKIVFEAECQDFSVDANGTIAAKVNDQIFGCDLLLGCDGINSGS